MQKIIQFLSGKKSNICTIVLGIIGVLASAGVVSIENVYVQIVVLVVGVLTGVSYRSAIAKSSPAPMTDISGVGVDPETPPADSISR